MNPDNKHTIPTELFIKVLSRQATPEEQKALAKLIKDSVSIQKEFDAFKKIWNHTGEAHPDETINVNTEWNAFKEKVIDKENAAQSKVRFLPLQRFIQVAASILIIMGISYVAWTQLSITKFESGLAKMEGIALPDGSVVSLNAGSKISFKRKFGSKHRMLKLEGEGFFDVTANTQLPFIISTNDAAVEVVGTKFNVKAYKTDSAIKVTVVEGVVKLYKPQDKTQKTTRISAGQTGTYSTSTEEINLESDSDINDLSWMTRTMVFKEKTLKDVCDVLENTFQYTFDIDDKVKDCTITVEFKDQNLSQILKVLKSTLNLQMQQKEKLIIISGQGCLEKDPS